MDPYAYVGGNPETFSDPTGQRYAPPPSGGGGGGDSQNPPAGNPGLTFNGTSGPPPPSLQTHRQNVNPGPSDDEFNPVEALEICVALGPDCVIAAGAALLSVVLQPAINLDPGMLLIPNDVPFRSKTPSEAGRTGDTGGITLSLQPQNNTPPSRKPSGTSTSGPCSFTPNTPVTTAQGEEPIGKLKVGEQVLAYNPKTGKMEQEPILHVWINHDHDLVNLTITTTTKGEHGKPATKTSEVIHTNQKHPFFTMEHGFLPVGRIKLGMHLLRGDGRVGVVTGWKVVPGTKVMYNLEVAQDHTYTVGAGQWVVHNWNCNRDARDIAKKIQRLLRKAGGDMSSTTVGVSFSRQGQALIAMNDTWSGGDNTGLLQGIVRDLFPGADYVGPTEQIPASASAGALHAEEFILAHADVEGLDLTGIGTSNSNGICPTCAPQIISAFPDLGPGLLDWS